MLRGQPLSIEWDLALCVVYGEVNVKCAGIALVKQTPSRLKGTCNRDIKP